MRHATNKAVERPYAALALDVETFEAVEEQRMAGGLRFWECDEVAVIVGRSGIVRAEVYEDRCWRDNVPIVRRASGGGSVVVGPGCLNYSLVLSLDRRPELRNVPSSYAIILGHIAAALALPGLEVRGLADLTLNDRKVSGSAQRRGRRTLLHHGTFLCDFDLRLMERYLRTPPRAPAYRRGRAHVDFVVNLPLPTQTVRQRLAGAWPTFSL